jgi:tryptophan halogenase
MSKVVVLGGGSAGWLTALYLNKIFSTIDITIVEDPTKPPIIAGESGGVSLSLLYKFLEIDISDWVRSTNALPKLGGKFIDWNGVGTEFTHGLIDRTYNSYTENSFLKNNYNFILWALSNQISTDDIFYNSQLIKLNKLPILPTSPDTFEAIDTIMWHFDSRANAEYLKNIGIAKGIHLVEGTYQTSTRSNLGDIESIVLDSKTIEGDWFFDCSGFSRLLLHKELGVELIDYTDLFPARSVIAWWNEDVELVNHTRLTAMKYGWSWNINLNHRAGNGYVFDPDHITADQALEEAESRFNTKIVPVARLNFTPSLVKEGWKHNVIAIGLSSGFLEPLESNGLSQVILQLELLERFWTPNSNTNIQKRMYNEYFTELMNEIINFLSLHYKGHRRDTDFWLSHHYDSKRTSDKLRDQLDGWSNGIVLNDVKHSQIYGLESYLTVAQGLDLINSEKLKNNLLDIDFSNHYSALKLYIQNVVTNSLELSTWHRSTYEK